MADHHPDYRPTVQQVEPRSIQVDDSECYLSGKHPEYDTGHGPRKHLIAWDTDRNPVPKQILPESAVNGGYTSQPSGGSMEKEEPKSSTSVIGRQYGSSEPPILNPSGGSQGGTTSRQPGGDQLHAQAEGSEHAPLLSQRNNLPRNRDCKWKYCPLVSLLLLIVFLAVATIAAILASLITDPCHSLDAHLAVHSTDTVPAANMDPACNDIPSVSRDPDNKFEQVMKLYQVDDCSNLVWYDSYYSKPPITHTGITIPLLVFDYSEYFSNYLPAGAEINVTVNATINATASISNSQLYVSLFVDYQNYLLFKDHWKENLGLAKSYTIFDLNQTANSITERITIDEESYYFIAITTTAPQFNRVEYSYTGLSRYLNRSDYTYTGCDLSYNKKCYPNSTCALVYAEPPTGDDQDLSYFQVQAAQKYLTKRSKTVVIYSSVVMVLVITVIILFVFYGCWKKLNKKQISFPINETKESSTVT